MLDNLSVSTIDRVLDSLSYSSAIAEYSYLQLSQIVVKMYIIGK